VIQAASKKGPALDPPKLREMGADRLPGTPGGHSGHPETHLPRRQIFRQAQLQKLRRAILRTIIHNHELPVCKRLRRA
jgi:hypothetical protein